MTGGVPRVFHRGDPEPDDVWVLVSKVGAVWPVATRLTRPVPARSDAPECRWAAHPMLWSWDQMMDRGPWVEVPLPDVDEALAADETRRPAG